MTGITMRVYWRLAIASIVLAGVTVAVAFSPARYRLLAAVPLTNADFADGLNGWFIAGGARVSGDESPTLVLRAEAGRISYVGRSLDPPHGRFPALRVTVSAQAQGFVEGVEPGQDAGVVLLSIDARGRQMWWWPSSVLRVSGNREWRDHTLVVPLAEEIAGFWLLAYTRADLGTFRVRDIRIDGVAERGGYTGALAALVVVWAALALWVGQAVFRHGWRSPLRLASLAMAAGIVVFGIAPQPLARDTLLRAFFGAQDLVRERVESAARLFDAAAPDAVTTQGERTPGAAPESAAAPGAPGGPGRTAVAGDGGVAPPVTLPPRPVEPRSYWRPSFLRSDKDLHVIGFAVFALVTVLAWRQHPAAAAATALVTMSIALQALQAMTVTREADVVDFAHDLFGIAVGWVAARGLLAVAGRRPASDRRAA